MAKKIILKSQSGEQLLPVTRAELVQYNASETVKTALDKTISYIGTAVAAVNNVPTFVENQIKAAYAGVGTYAAPAGYVLTAAGIDAEGKATGSYLKLDAANVTFNNGDSEISTYTAIKNAQSAADSAKAAVDNIQQQIEGGTAGVTSVATGNGLKVAATKDNVLGEAGSGPLMGVLTLTQDLNLKYDSTAKTISIVDGNDNVIGNTIDASSFIVDGMLSSVALDGNNLTFTWNTDAGQEPTTIDLSKYIDVYTAGTGISIVDSATTTGAKEISVDDDHIKSIVTENAGKYGVTVDEASAAYLTATPATADGTTTYTLAVSAEALASYAATYIAGQNLTVGTGDDAATANYALYSSLGDVADVDTKLFS